MALDPLWLKLWVLELLLDRVLGIKLGPSARATHTLSLWDVSLAQEFLFLQGLAFHSFKYFYFTKASDC